MTINDISYRSATKEDIPGLKELCLLSYGTFSEVLGEEQWAKMHEGISDDNRWNELLAKAKSFLCFSGEKLVGMAFIVPSGNPWQVFESHWSYIRMVGVHPGFHGMGIGKILTERCVDSARTSGEKVIALHTAEFMDSARKIYEGYGFKKEREIGPLFGKRYWLYLLNL